MVEEDEGHLSDQEHKTDQTYNGIWGIAWIERECEGRVPNRLQRFCFLETRVFRFFRGLP